MCWILGSEKFSYYYYYYLIRKERFYCKKITSCSKDIKKYKELENVIMYRKQWLYVIRNGDAISETPCARPIK